MFVVYAAFGAAWGWLCYQHVHELLPIQVRAPRLCPCYRAQSAACLALPFKPCGIVGHGNGGQLGYVEILNFDQLD